MTPRHARGDIKHIARRFPRRTHSPKSRPKFQILSLIYGKWGSLGTTTEPESFFFNFSVPDFRAYKRREEGARAETIGGDREDDIDG